MSSLWAALSTPPTNATRSSLGLPLIGRRSCQPSPPTSCQGVVFKVWEWVHSRLPSRRTFLSGSRKEDKADSLSRCPRWGTTSLAIVILNSLPHTTSVRHLTEKGQTLNRLRVPLWKKISAQQKSTGPWNHRRRHWEMISVSRSSDPN